MKNLVDQLNESLHSRYVNESNAWIEHIYQGAQKFSEVTDDDSSAVKSAWKQITDHNPSKDELNILSQAIMIFIDVFESGENVDYKNPIFKSKDAFFKKYMDNGGFASEVYEIMSDDDPSVDEDTVYYICNKVFEKLWNALLGTDLRK